MKPKPRVEVHENDHCHGYKWGEIFCGRCVAKGSNLDFENNPCSTGNCKNKPTHHMYLCSRCWDIHWDMDNGIRVFLDGQLFGMDIGKLKALEEIRKYAVAQDHTKAGKWMLKWIDREIAKVEKK